MPKLTVDMCAIYVSKRGWSTATVEEMTVDRAIDSFVCYKTLQEACAAKQVEYDVAAEEEIILAGLVAETEMGASGGRCFMLPPRGLKGEVVLDGGKKTVRLE